MGKRPDYAGRCLLQPASSGLQGQCPSSSAGLRQVCRRLAHYDYWSDKLKRSILLDSQADLISYGMGEHSIIEIADALDSGIEVKDITFIAGNACTGPKIWTRVYDDKLLPDSYEQLQKDKKELCKELF